MLASLRLVSSINIDRICHLSILCFKLCFLGVINLKLSLLSTDGNMILVTEHLCKMQEELKILEIV